MRSWRNTGYKSGVNLAPNVSGTGADIYQREGHFVHGYEHLLGMLGCILAWFIECV